MARQRSDETIYVSWLSGNNIGALKDRLGGEIALIETKYFDSLYDETKETQ